MLNINIYPGILYFLIIPLSFLFLNSKAIWLNINIYSDVAEPVMEE